MANRNKSCRVKLLLFLILLLSPISLAQGIKIFYQDTTIIKGKSIQLEAGRTIIDSVLNITPYIKDVSLVDTSIILYSSSIRLNLLEAMDLKRISAPPYRALKDGDRVRILFLDSSLDYTCEVYNYSGAIGNLILQGSINKIFNHLDIIEFEYIVSLNKWVEIYRQEN